VAGVEAYHVQLLERVRACLRAPGSARDTPTQAMFLMPVDDTAQFLAAIERYYGDLVLLEPALLSPYEIDRALGDRPE
jgi:hypothetical protein